MANYSPIGAPGPLGIPVAQTPSSVSVTNVSTQIVAANEDRRFLILSNVGNLDAFLSGDGTALVDNGFKLPKGETIELSRDINITTSIHGITSAGSTDITIQEFE